MRVAKAQSELGEMDLDDERIKSKRIELRAKYDIPEGVHIFLPDFDSALVKDEVKHIIPYVGAFVKGKLTENAFSDLVFYFEECAECDYGWILAERPMGFYDEPSRDDMDAIVAEMESIGTRSRSKNTNLPRIAGAFSSK